MVFLQHKNPPVQTCHPATLEFHLMAKQQLKIHICIEHIPLKNDLWFHL